MPVYHYNCECGYDDEVFHSIHEDIRTLCPECGLHSMKVVIDTIPYGTVKEIKTLGQLADHNAKKMGKELVQKKMEEDGTAKKIEQKEKLATINKLAKLSPEKKVKYIETGKL